HTKRHTHTVPLRPVSGKPFKAIKYRIPAFCQYYSMFLNAGVDGKPFQTLVGIICQHTQTLKHTHAHTNTHTHTHSHTHTHTHTRTHTDTRTHTHTQTHRSKSGNTYILGQTVKSETDRHAERRNTRRGSLHRATHTHTHTHTHPHTHTHTHTQQRARPHTHTNTKKTWKSTQSYTHTQTHTHT